MNETVLIYFTLSILTSCLSAVTGMGGGALLLSFLTFNYPIKTLVPIHGLAQLTSNCSRTFALRKFVKRNVFFYFSLGVPLGAFISAYYLRGIFSENTLKITIATLILYVLLKPKKMPSIKLPEKYFVIIGIITAMLGILIGSVGPFLSAFFVRDDYTKEEIIATKSSLQLLVHLSKIPSFLLLGFSYLEHFQIIIALCSGVVIGSIIGIQILKKTSNKVFLILFKGSLLFVAIRLLSSSFFT